MKRTLQIVKAFKELMGGEGSYVKGKEMINGLLGLLVNGRKEAARDLVYIFFIFKPKWFGSVRVGQFRHTKTRNQTGYFSKYFNQFNQFFFTCLVFLVNFFLIFSIESIFKIFFGHPPLCNVLEG